MVDKIKDTILDKLDDLHRTSKPKRMDNVDPALYDIFVWQEVLSYASRMHKEAAKKVVEAGIIPDDEQLRALEIGEHTMEQSKHFSFTTKVSKPRELFDRDTFIETLATRYRLSVEKLTTMAENAFKKGVPSLTKVVREI